MNVSEKRSTVVFTVLLGTLLGVMSFADSTFAQRANPAGARVAAGTTRDDASTRSEPHTEETDFQHASLQTDPEIQTLLQRARDYADSEQYDTAVRLLQKIFEDGDRVMVQVGDRVYRPASLTAQQMLADLPYEALETYRLLVDADASAILVTPGARRDPATLQKVVRRYFMSSQGDEAAYRLACLYIDRHQFTRAHRLLKSIRRYHSDSSIPEEDILARLAFVSAMQGNRDQGRRYWEDLKKLYDSDPLPRGLKMIEPRLADDGSPPTGEPSRKAAAGIPANLLDETQQAGLASIWEQAAKTKQDEDDSTREVKQELLRQVWIEHAHRPTDQIVYDGEFLWHSSNVGVSCFRKASGEQLWQNSAGTPLWEKDPRQRRVIINHRIRQYNWREVAYFRNRVQGRISLIGDRLFRIEDHLETMPRRRRVQQGKRTHYITERQGSRLVSYAAAGGNQLWEIGGQLSGEDAFLAGARFMSPPEPAGSHLLTTVEKKDGLYLLALDPESGNILWQRFLCAYVAPPLPPEATVGLYVEDGEVYIATGKGVVFAVDAHDGHVYWAAVYEGNAAGPSFRRSFNRGAAQPDNEREKGWSDNLVFAAGNRLLVLPSDAASIMSLERSTGELQYERTTDGDRHAVGLTAKGVITAGEDFVRMRLFKNGRVHWTTELTAPTGRAFLAGGRILLPHDTAISVLDAASGGLQRTLHVGLSGDLPLGNLYSDGERLYAAGLGRVMALSSGEHLLAELNAKVEKNPTAGTYLARGRFFLKTARYQKAVRDLREARSRALQDPRRERFQTLSQDLQNVRKQKREVASQLAWFADSFERADLGEDYEVASGQADIQNGVLRMTGGSQMIVKLNEKITGDFAVDVVGWQKERPCDLSFKLHITGPDQPRHEIYAQFGANWNVRNMLQINGQRVVVNNDYLIKQGTKHRLRLVKQGDRLTMYVDGKRVLDHSGKIPQGPQTQTILHLYGFGRDHYFDDLSVRKLGGEAASTAHPGEPESDKRAQLKEKMEELEQREAAIQEEQQEMKGAGYVAPADPREVLFQALLKFAAQPEAGQDVLTEAEQLAESPGEHASFLMTAAKQALGRDNIRQAVLHYIDLGRKSGDTLLQLDPRQPGLKTSAPQWSRIRLRQLRKERGEAVAEVIRQAASDHLDQVLQQPDRSFPDLYRILQTYPASSVAARAGLQAALAAEKAGKIAEAELILEGMRRSRVEVSVVAGLVGLARLYERQGWQRQASDTWEIVAEHHPNQEIPSGDGQLSAGALARKAIRRIEQSASKEYLHPKDMPDPPYRLLWKESLSGYLLRRQLGQDALSEFLDENVVVVDYGKRKLVCKDVRSGKLQWEQAFQRRHQMAHLGHVLFTVQPVARAVSLLDGRTMWETDLGMANPRAGNVRGSGGSGIVVVTGELPGAGHAIFGLNAVSGQIQWRRHIAQRNRPHLMVLGSYVVDMSRAAQDRTARVYDVSSGDILTGDFPLPRGHQFWTLNGYVAQEGGDFVLRTLPEGKRAWKLPLPAANGASLRAVKGSPKGLYMSQKQIALIDPINRKIAWKLSADDEKRQHVGQATYDPRREEILLWKRFREGNKWMNEAIVIDAMGGQTISRTALGSQMRFYHRGRPAVNDRYFAVMEYVRKKQKKRTITHRRYRLVRREDGKVLDDVRLPHLKDLEDREKRLSFNLQVVGDTIVLSGGGKIMVYEHDPTARTKD